MTPTDVLSKAFDSMVSDIEDRYKELEIYRQKLVEYHQLRKDLSTEISNLVHKKLQVINGLRNELELEDVNKITLERLKLNNGYTGWYFTLTIDPILDLLPPEAHMMEFHDADDEESEYEEVDTDEVMGDESSQS